MVFRSKTKKIAAKFATVGFKPNHLMIIWIFLAPPLPQLTHHAILPISRSMGRPPQCGVHQQTMPSIPCWFGFGCYFMPHFLTMYMCFCLRECTLKQVYPHKKRCTVHRHVNAMRNCNVRGDGNTRRDCWMKIEFRVALTTEAEPILREETAATTQRRSGDVWFRRRKKEFDSSFSSLHNTPRSLDLVNIPARIRGESIDTFKLFCGFLDFFFFWIFFLRGIGPCGPVPPPPLEWISSPPLVAAVLIKSNGDESPGSSRMGVIGALVIFFPSKAVQDKLHSPWPAQ